ncbi:MAG: endonuclease Q family protein [Syntrophomonas sp.]
MQNIYGDLHIHIGRAKGRPVKITASRELTLHSIIFQDAPYKGLDMVGIVDAGSVLVASELEEMLESGQLREHNRGGFIASNGILLIAGCEIECREGMHLISYLPNLQSIRQWQKYMRSRVHNMTLSTQKADASIVDIINLTILLDGIFCPAHVFTPHKGIYGMWARRLTDSLPNDFDHIKTVELGLSSDSDLAGRIEETKHFTFLSNSDAHSSGNVGREYNQFRMADRSFQELKYCLENREGRKVTANYGMDPLMGKYHRSFCPVCETITGEAPPVLKCSKCGNDKMVMGVYDRIVQISDYEEPRHIIGRPPYNYRVPLKNIPGVGPKTAARLLTYAGNEIELIEKTGIDIIAKLAGSDIARIIETMRNRRLEIVPGGGGKYGKIVKNNSNH